ncbi:hypothetical protein H5410_045133, partial [Solanum commersonii]
IETPSSFNFSIPPPEESPSTPVCVIGETGQSNTPLTEVVMSHTLKSGEILPFSPTLVLSVVKPSLETPTEGLEVGSRVVSSTSLSGYSKGICLRERVPHSVQPVFDQTPKSFDVDSEEEEEEETHLVVDTLHEEKRDDEPTKSKKKIKRKEKGKIVDLQTI